MQTIKVLKTRNNIFRLFFYILGCSGLGLGSLPLLAMSASISPQIISNLIALTIGSFGGASLVAAGLPKIGLFQYGGLVGAGVGSFLM